VRDGEVLCYDPSAGFRLFMADINHLQISELAPRLAAGSVSAATLTERCLDAIARDNPRLNAFIAVLADEALEAARAADREIAAGRYRGPLHGIPVSLKDLIDLRGAPTTAASRLRAGHVAAADALVVTRLGEAGAVFVGKCNLHEFAFGTTSEDSAYGPARHPFDPLRSPGGSSGGSAAGIVAGMSVASVGTDTGGSIRIPAAACGTVGLKPAFGEVPCDGVVPLSRSLDHVGPLSRSVADAWLLYCVMRGDPQPRLPGEADERGTRGLRVGVPRPYFFDVLDDDVRRRFDECLSRLAGAGVAVHDVTIPHAGDAAPVYLHIQLPEASAYHATAIEASPDAYTPPVRLRLELGRYVTAEDYARADRGRTVLRQEVDVALSECDVIALPTLPIPAPLIGQTSVRVGASHWPVRHLMLRLTQLFNLTGHPAISSPCGSTSAGLPCGLQMVGRRHATEDMLSVALACEPVITT
jgi:aspartyl-tRNA(Asn)/glutamyl-tRNA(Gln) amidotransferase subunit A